MTASVRTVCSYCGVGCGIVLELDRHRKVIRSFGDPDHPANRGRLCTKGSTTVDLLNSGGRLQTALVRPDRAEAPQPRDVEDALDLAAARLAAIRDEHGADAIGIYCSGQLSLEAQYLITKLAKGFLRTQHLESNSRLCMASAASGYKLSLGADGPPGSYDDFDHADVFFVIGSNMADCHPVLFLRMMDRVKAGAKLIVVDPRRSATAEKADLFLQLRPGTDLALLNGLLHLLHAGGDIDEEFIARHSEGWEELPRFLADYDPASVASVTGVAVDDLRAAAALIAGAENWMSCWTMGLNQSTHGTWNTNALINLHLATGAICRPGSGPFSLTGQPNAMGGREMGYLGPGLPGQRSVLVDDERAELEAMWALPERTIRTEHGDGTIGLFEGLAGGTIKAVWVLCTNPVASVPNRRTVIAGLEAAEFVLVQDAYSETETNGYADVVLPAAVWAETPGVMINSERNLTLAQPALDPPGQALPDWQLIAELARRLGYGEAFAYSSASEVFDELRQAANPRTGWDLRGISHEALSAGPMQWPAAPGAGSRNPIRYLGEHGPRFPTPSGRARFWARPQVPAAELPDEVYPFLLNTGRLQHQWHTMTKTGRVERLAKLNPGPFVEVHPTDADRLGLRDGQQVEVTSRRGRAVLPALLSDRVQPGTCFAPFHWNDLFGEYLSVNAVTSDATDPISLQPEFKACAVSLTPIATAAPEPGLPPKAAALAARFGVGDVVGPQLTPEQRLYLAGFMAGLAPDLEAGLTDIPTLPGNAPFSAPEALWVNGMLAGLLSRTTLPARTSLPAHTGTPARQVVVGWASQTGTADGAAEQAFDRLTALGLSVTRVPLNDLTSIDAHTDLVIVTSTFGDGDAPDNGASFLPALAARAEPLHDVRFCVIAFGDSSYSDFCGHGRRVDERLAELGATRLLDRVECEPGVEAPVGAWLESLTALATAPAVTTAPALAARPPRVSDPSWVTLAGNRLLSGADSGKEVREFVIDLGDGALAYQTGDVLVVHAQNQVELVAEWLSVTGLRGDSVVDVPGAGKTEFAVALQEHLEIAVPSPGLLAFLAERGTSRHLHRLLRGDRAQLDRWLWGRQAVDVVRETGARASAQEWCEVLKPLRARRYSISSAAEVSPRAVRTLASVVRYPGPAGQARCGVASGFLASAAVGDPVLVSVARSAGFVPPADGDTPMIMVGPGTGLAPFLAFLSAREALGHRGRNWLFFGEQHAASDFYYAAELADWQRAGLLTRLDTAFSRDQRSKVYVQDRMRARGAEFWRWLCEGASLYVCGDASRMARDVDVALRELVALHGTMSSGQADDYVRQMMTDGRYLRDVY